MINYADYIQSFTTFFPDLSNELPWKITANIQSIIVEQIKKLGKDFDIKNDVAIHKEAKIEEHEILIRDPSTKVALYIGDKKIVGNIQSCSILKVELNKN